MTLNFQETASDCNVARALSRRLQNVLWHDGQRWYVNDGGWRKAARHDKEDALETAVTSLPDSPFWARLRHRTSRDDGIRAILRVVADACRAEIIFGPDELPHRRQSFKPGCICFGPHH